MSDKDLVVKIEKIMSLLATAMLKGGNTEIVMSLRDIYEMLERALIETGNWDGAPYSADYVS